MHLFIENGLRGGTSYIAKRYSKANKKYMKNYDSAKPSRCISYLDLNNLCGSVMSGHLPYGVFKWLKNIDNFDINSASEKSPKNLQILMICCQIILKTLQTNMR